MNFSDYILRYLRKRVSLIRWQHPELEIWSWFKHVKKNPFLIPISVLDSLSFQFKRSICDFESVEVNDQKFMSLSSGVTYRRSWSSPQNLLNW